MMDFLNDWYFPGFMLTFGISIGAGLNDEWTWRTRIKALALSAVWPVVFAAALIGHMRKGGRGNG